jgi:amino acid transporter
VSAIPTTPEVVPGAAAPAADPPPGKVAAKGLRAGAIGLAGSTLLGVVQTAPAYSVAVTLGFLAATVGVQAPAAIILGFIPILCMTIVEREFVARDPDCGTVFVWVGRALGPRAGWIASWVLLGATLISLANLANITGLYFFLLIGAASTATNEAATIAVGCAWLAVATWLAIRGIQVSSRVQAVLMALGMAVLAAFVVIALVKVADGSAGAQALDPQLSWFNPFDISGSGALSGGILLAIFFFWGWDGPAAVAEEAKGGVRTPRRALVLSVVALLGFYLIVTVALQAYAGVGTKGIGLAAEANSGDVLAVVGGAAVGSGFQTLMELAVMTSAAACLVAAMLPTARGVLSMGAYRAFPDAFARVDPRSGSPVVATAAVGLGVAGVLITLSIVSNSILGDSISAIVLLVAFYYTMLGLACLWQFRGEVLRSRADFLNKLVAPVIGTAVLAWALYRNGKDTFQVDYGLTSLFGVGGVFVIGLATILIGVVLMVLWNLRSPAFFRGETFTEGYIERHRPDLVEKLRSG